MNTTKPRKDCIICEEPIYRGRLVGVRYGTRKTKRRPQDITCSHKCSIIYGRVNRYISGRLKKIGVMG